MNHRLGQVAGKLVGARLRELRLDAELTQSEISDLTGIHRPIVSRLERGTHSASLESIARYAGALGLDLATVLVCLDEDWIEAGRAAREAA